MNICTMIDHLLGPPLCQLCGGAGLGPEICFGCYRDLPRAFHSCPVCARPVGTPGVCSGCILRPPLYTRARAPFIYGFPVDHLIRRLKYGGVLSHGRLLGELTGHRLRRGSTRVQALVPVPPHPRRLRQRGFDQVLEIGRYLGPVAGLPLLQGLCERTRDTPPLWPMGPADRRRVLKDVFHCRRTAPARVAVLDDILTTGSTAEAMARALRRRGAQEVEIWAVARSPSPVQAGTRA